MPPSSERGRGRKASTVCSGGGQASGEGSRRFRPGFRLGGPVRCGGADMRRLVRRVAASCAEASACSVAEREARSSVSSSS